MSTTPGDSTSDEREHDDAADSSVTSEGAGAELGITEDGGSTFEPEEDLDGGED